MLVSEVSGSSSLPDIQTTSDSSGDCHSAATKGSGGPPPKDFQRQRKAAADTNPAHRPVYTLLSYFLGV